MIPSTYPRKMKSIRTITISTIAIIVLAAASADAEPIQRYEFPRIGGSYQLIYDKRPEGYYWPFQVKIIAKGDGQWYLVEYERTERPHRSITKPDSRTPSEGSTSPTPVVTVERMWINFALLLAANENK